jgi:ubiquitin-conjugating enzyme E2 S
MIIRCLLIEPFPESALNEEAGKLLLGNYEEYARHARLMTSIHAPRKATPLGELTSSVAINGSSAGPAAADGSKRGGDQGESPIKKAKAGQEQKPTAASKVKKSLKRL